MKFVLMTFPMIHLSGRRDFELSAVDTLVWGGGGGGGGGCCFFFCTPVFQFPQICWEHTARHAHICQKNLIRHSENLKISQ